MTTGVQEQADTAGEHLQTVAGGGGSGGAGGGGGADGAWFGSARLKALGAGRLPLVLILLLQVLLAYQLWNSAFEDESLYLFAGHREIALELHGTTTYDSYPSYFSGAPFLYPIVAAAVDHFWGLEGARALSLVLMLATTGLVWTIARQLYGRTASILAALLFATAAPTLFLSRFATYDAMAVFLLAVAFWIVVRTARKSILLALLAAPVLVLAVAVKYAAALYVPTVIAAAVLVVPVFSERSHATAAPESRRRVWIRAVARGAVLGGAVVAILAAWYVNLSPDMKLGIRQTTTSRDVGSDSTGDIVQLSLVWCGWFVALAAVGAWADARRPLRGGYRRARTLLATVLTGTALLATAYQAHIHKMQSLHKHLGFGLMFAAPAAGMGLAALARLGSPEARKRIPGLAAGIAVVLAVYAGHAVRPMYYGWPNSDRMISALRPLVHEGSERYLAEENEVPRYYLRDRTQPYEWLTTFFFSYTEKNGTAVTGVDAYQAALRDRYFDLVILDHGPTAALDDQLDKTMKAPGSGYELVDSVPGETSHGAEIYEIWRRVGER